MEKNFKMLAKTFYGMEKILAVELKQLGAVDVYEGNRLVHFKGDKGVLCTKQTFVCALREISGKFSISGKEQVYFMKNFIITIGVVSLFRSNFCH